MVDEVPEDVAVENREVVRVPDVPQEMGRLLHREAVDLAREPVARCLRGREGGQHFLQGPMSVPGKPFARRNEVGRLMVVESNSSAEKRRNRWRVSAKKEPPLLQSPDRSIGGPGLRLDREDAVRDLLEQSLIGRSPRPPKISKPGTDCIALGTVVPPEFFEIAVTARTPDGPRSSNRLDPHRLGTLEEPGPHKAIVRAAAYVQVSSAPRQSMAVLHSLLAALDRFSPANVAYAHCDIPCGIYDPHNA